MSRFTRSARGAVGVSAIAVAALALSACTGSGGDSDGGGGDAGEAVDTSLLVIAPDSDMAALGYDPLRYAAGQRLFFEGLYDSLFVIDENGEIAPDLVTSFEYNDDDTELTLDLDTSATFADGTAVDAELVKQNLDNRDNTELNAYEGFNVGGAQEITEVTVVDEDTVTLTFPVPSAGFEANLAMPSGAIVGPAGLADRSSLDAAADGSGPLEIDYDATVKGNSYLLVKKADHPDADEYSFDSYEFRPILDPQARVNAAISGEVDIANVTPDTRAQVESAGGAVAENGGTILNIIPFDKAGALAPQWADPNVWKALSIAIDRETYVNAVHPGNVPTTNALPADSAGYIPEFDEEYAYDPEAAKQLLSEAGYPDGFSFEFVITQASQRDLEALQPYWAEIGVDVELVNAASTEELFGAVQTTPAGGPIEFTWTNPAGNVFGALFGFANPHDAENPQLQGAAGAVSANPGDAEALTELNRAIVETGWLLPLYEQYASWAYDEAVLEAPAFPGYDSNPLLTELQPAS